MAENTRESTDSVSHPRHYEGGNGMECVDVSHAFLTPEEFRGGCKMQAVQYVLRERGKGGDEDLLKAAWWLVEAVRPHREFRVVVDGGEP